MLCANYVKARCKEKRPLADLEFASGLQVFLSIDRNGDVADLLDMAAVLDELTMLPNTNICFVEGSCLQV